MSGSSVSMPSSIEVSIMLLGDDVEDLRRTLGGGRGSIRQPFTLMEGNKGKRENENDEQGNSSSQNTLIKSDQSLQHSDVAFLEECVSLLQHVDRLCVLV